MLNTSYPSIHDLQTTSSNPFRAYQDLYEPWYDDDQHSTHIAQKRLNIRKGIDYNSSLYSSRTESRLKSISDRVSIAFFYPVIYRIDIELIDASRLLIDGSGLVGSREYKIEELAESEFHILFFDLEHEPFDWYTSVDVDYIKRDMLDLWNRTTHDQDEVLRILERWL